MNREDFATAVGAAIAVGLIAVVSIAAAIGPDALGGLFSQTGAAWVQAVGSVGAILAAIAISNSSERRARRAASELAALFFATIHDGLVSLIQASHSEDLLLVRRSAALLSDGMDLGRSIELGRLAPISALNVSRVRSQVVEAMVEVNQILDAEKAGVTSADFGRLGRFAEISHARLIDLHRKRQ